MTRQLEVWLFDTHVGDLMQTDGKLAFGYTSTWLQRPDAIALSCSLPLPAKHKPRDPEHRMFYGYSIS
ncbi:MAG: HipA N-terminal domain-containing protein [Methylococcaceae bacterium]|nr:HipA N-terminal domain-containing protein [Methylococcaceae bacterium]